MTAILMHCVPKVAVVDRAASKVLLCRRKNETDLNGIFTLIGGKMDLSDSNLIATVRREKNEEIGPDVQLKLLHTYSVVTEYQRTDGLRQVLPHMLAFYVGGRIVLGDEYSEAQWVSFRDLEEWKPPMVRNIPVIVQQLMALRVIADEDLDYTRI